MQTNWNRSFHRALSTSVVNPALPRHDRPIDMMKQMFAMAKDNPHPVNVFVGVIDKMSPEDIVVETPLFPRAALEFYTDLNLQREVTEEARELYYTAQRGGGQGDYREGIVPKIENVVSALSQFPHSKRAILTIPFSTSGSALADHTNDAEAKCLREIHFFTERTTDSSTPRLHAAGFMRAQAIEIFPKNIHFIGTILNHVAQETGLPVGRYTHVVTQLVSTRNE